MSKFGLYGKIVTQPGQKDALVAILLEAAGTMPDVPGCDLYIINLSPTEPDAIWVTEVWQSREAHAASLTRPEVQALIARGRPLIAGGERIEVVPVGGKGLPAA
ncbi:MAG TPA: putative quinol monooxygenase [Chloroflexia bacterium]|jgi:quinol monooxygenase YgiN|nr:putative quinol monooxygenase [Chloroflexia bacterium]